MSANELIAQARAEPVRRVTPAERVKITKELRGKGLSWAEIGAWFKAKGIPFSSIVSLKVTHSRAMARERAAAAAAEAAQ